MRTIKRIVFCADRSPQYATGGSTAVMNLLKQYLDESQYNCKTDYLYRVNGRVAFVLNLIIDCLTNRDSYYICHEPSSAAVLSYFTKRYSLVYHQQGPLVQEFINNSGKISGFSIRKKRLIEKRAFLKAERVFFPSYGAMNEYFSSPYSTVDRDRIAEEEPLYNTINLEERMKPIKGIDKDESVITFLSVGTMTRLKGQDLTAKFLEQFVISCNRRIRWITVGDGPIKEHVMEACVDMARLSGNFEHIHFDRIPHGSILFLDSIADYYIMLHRTSIFDIATLEAMSQGCAVVLSNIGGNVEFNVCDNAILVDGNDFSEGIEMILKRNKEELKRKNLAVFNKYFSPEPFCDRYYKAIKSVMCKS